MKAPVFQNVGGFCPKIRFGKVIDFSKAIIIATTNAGCTERKLPGFGNAGEGRKLLVSDLSDYFDLELLNRFGHIYTFHNISKDIYKEIVLSTYESEVSNLRSRETELNMDAILDKHLNEEDLRTLADCSYEPKLGARPALTVVTEFIDHKLMALWTGRGTCLP